ncbi:hypothetical protein BVX97_03150 [bacterium E08(2017)]|nr:hypothetical protein BVX97_03150 [bacterium E08(2017)]
MAESNETLHFLDYWQVVRSRKEVVITFATLVVLAGIVITFYTPKQYIASTLIQVKRDDANITVYQRDPTFYDPLFLRTQFELIQSSTVLEAVVRRLELDKVLSKAYGYDTMSPEKIFDATVAVVSSGMKARQYRDTDLIEVQIRLRELGDEPEEAPQLAADIANAIAEVYRDQSIARKRSAVRKELDALHEELKRHDVLVNDAQSKVDEIRREEKLVVLGGGTGSEVGKLTLRRLEDQAISVRMDLETQKARYEKAMSLSSEELLAAAPYLQPDPQLPNLVSARREAEVKLSDAKLAILGEEHPSVKEAKAVLDGLDAKIQEALKGLRMGMQADMEAAQARYDWVKEELEAMREKDRASETGAYLDFNRAMEELRRVKGIRDSLQERYVKESIEMEIPRSMVDIVELAKPSDVDDPVSPDFMLNIVLSMILGLILGVCLAYFTEYLDTSVKTIEDVESYLGVPVIGVIPQKVKPFNDPSADEKHAEAYRMLRTNIQFSRKMHEEGKTICVTSGSMGEGKSLTLFNMAYVSADLGDKVLVIDADLHRPRQHKMLELPNKVGLANILAGEVELEDAVVATSHNNLDFLPSGRMATGVHGLLDNLKLHELIMAVRESYDTVYFDAPPVIGVSDTSMLIREMDGVVLVIQHRKYPKHVSLRAKSMVENMGANLVGVILNNINLSRDYAAYQYQSYTYG